MKLEGRVALITGAGRGMGQAACRVFAREGAGIVALDIDEDLGRQTVAIVEAEGGRIRFIRCDVSSESEVEEAVANGRDAFGRLDILYNNAGVLWPNADGSLTEMDAVTWDRVQSINLKGTLWICKYGLPHLIEAGGGAIINVSSTAVHRYDTAYPVAAYAASKAGVIALTKALAIAHARQNVRANVLLPGPVDTLLTGPVSEQHKATVAALIPLGRMAHPNEIARVALFLASDDSSYITGAEIPVDGGILAHLGW